MGNCLGRCLAGKNGLRSENDEAEQLVNDEGNEENFIFKIMKFRKKKSSNFLDRFWERQCQAYSRMSKDRLSFDRSDIQLQCLDAQTLMLSSRDVPVLPAQSKSSVLYEYGFPSSSRASSSLDLEWEHEYAGINNHTNHQLSQSWFFLPEEGPVENSVQDQISESSLPTHNVNTNSPVAKKIDLPETQDILENGKQSLLVRNPSKNSWSHISTPESLEWDIDEDQQHQMNVEDDMLDHETLRLLHEIEQLKNKVLDETGSGLDFQIINKSDQS